MVSVMREAAESRKTSDAFRLDWLREPPLTLYSGARLLLGPRCSSQSLARAVIGEEGQRFGGQAPLTSTVLEKKETVILSQEQTVILSQEQAFEASDGMIRAFRSPQTNRSHVTFFTVDMMAGKSSERKRRQPVQRIDQYSCVLQFCSRDRTTMTLVTAALCLQGGNALAISDKYSTTTKIKPVHR